MVRNLPSVKIFGTLRVNLIGFIHFFLYLLKRKEKKNPGAWLSLDVYLNKFLAECKAFLRNEKRTEWQF